MTRLRDLREADKSMIKFRLYCTCGASRIINKKIPEDEDLKCFKCKTLMRRRIRLCCASEGCDKFTIVEGDPRLLNPNFYNSRYGTYDIRIHGFVCSDHQEEYNEGLEEGHVTLKSNLWA